MENKELNVMSEECVQDKMKWFSALPNIPFNKYGGLIIADQDEDKEGNHYIEYNLIPNHLLHHELYGSDNTYTLQIYTLPITELPGELLETYVDRMVSFLIYNGRGDCKQIISKGKHGYKYIFEVRLVKL